ncbi:MAG: HAD hydrolase-like protein [Faecalibacterium sp.]|jgi:phosphoglycolate phosphatase|nr:HAD hydrolase-like protein [Faecalibacterium sp.]
MFQTVIFDLDGTLLNTIDDLADAGNWVCKTNGWPTHSLDEYKHMVGNGIPKLCERFSPEEARTPGQLAGTLAQFSARYAAHKEDKTRPYDGIPELLKHLGRAGVRTAVFSNKADDLAQAIIGQYFGSAIDLTRGNLPHVPAKPAPEGLTPIFKALGAAPDTTLYVGDSDVDVETAHNAGLRCCGALWGFRGREELVSAGADFLAADAKELEALVLAQDRIPAAAGQ